MVFPGVRLLFVGIAVLMAQAASAQQYAVTDLGTLGGDFSAASAINASGQVVGWAEGSDHLRHAFLWSEGTMQDLGTLPGTDYCRAEAINDSGQIVGWCGMLQQEGGYQAFVWTGETGMVPIPLDTIAAQATGINAQGDVVGWQSDGQVQTAFLYRGGNVMDLGPVRATAIINQDLIVGQGYDQSARIWDEGGPHALDNEGGLSWANAMSAEGLVAGASTRGGGPPDPWHAVLWTPDGVSDLGTLGGLYSEALAVNGGLVVGWSHTTGSSGTHAFLYDTNGTGASVDLNGLIPPDAGVTLVLATGINAGAQIVGTGQVNRVTHALLLTPVQANTTPRAR